MLSVVVRVGAVAVLLAAFAPAQKNTKTFDISPGDGGGGTKVTVKLTKQVTVTKVVVNGKEVTPTKTKSGSTVELSFSKAYGSKDEVTIEVTYSGSTEPELARGEGRNPKWKTPKAPIFREL